MKALDFLKELHAVCHFQTREGAKRGEASGSELRRWFNNKAVVVNGAPVAWDTELQFPLQSFVLFPKHPVTLWWDNEE